MTKLKSVAAAVSATALGLALAAGASAQTNTTACDKLSGMNRSDCMAQLNSGDHPGARDSSDRSATTTRRAGAGASAAKDCTGMTGKARDDCMAKRDSTRGRSYSPPPGSSAGVGASQSGPATAERPVPGKADTRMNDSTAGSAKAK